MSNFKTPFAGLADGNYFNASGGVIVVPAGSSIIHATLFWGGSMRVNPGDSLAVSPVAKNQVKAVVNGDVVTDTPPKKWTGTLKIRYTVNDGKGGKARSWIVIKVSKKGGSGGLQYCFVAGC